MPVPGATTSSAVAPLNAITDSSGSTTAVEYQRALLRLPWGELVHWSPLAVSTVLISDVLVARYVPGVTPSTPPPLRKLAVLYGGLSGSWTEKPEPRKPGVAVPTPGI